MKWFVLRDEEILGPFHKNHVEESFDESVLIWGPGLEEWCSKTEWKNVRNKKETAPLHPVQNPSPSPVNPSSEPSVQWFYALDKRRFGPLSSEELSLNLSELNLEAEQVYLWHKGLDSWKKLEDFPKILSSIHESDKKAA